MKAIAAMILIAFLFMGCAPPRPWTKPEKAVAGAFVLAHLANAYSTKRHQDYPEFHECNPVLGRHPGGMKIGAYFALTGVGALLIAHYIPKLRLILLGGAAGANTYYTIHDLSLIKRKR